MSESKKINPAWLLAILLPAIFIYSAHEFIHTTDGYGQYSISGKEVVDQLPHFWLWVWLGIFGAIFFLVLAFLNETGIWVGRNMRGTMTLNIVYILLAAACLIGPWIKALSKKVDGGATLEKHTLYENNTHRSSSGCYHWNCSSDTSHGLVTKGRQNT